MRLRYFQRNVSHEKKSTLESKPIENYFHFLEIPMKIVGCWDWYQHPHTEFQIIANNVYYCMVLFMLTDVPATLYVHLSTEWTDIMTGLGKMADCLPYAVSIVIVVYFGLYRQEMYDLIKVMKDTFKFRSANGLTNMTMVESYRTAKTFGYCYTACTMFSISMYVMPELISWWNNKPLQNYMYMDVTSSPFFVIKFLNIYVSQAFVGLAMGQFGVFFATNAILLCGQLDLLCCSLRNARYTALLRSGVHYRSLLACYSDIRSDELHNYIYNISEMEESKYHYDEKMLTAGPRVTKFDIYSGEYEEATLEALRECARMCDAVNSYRRRFERFVSPLLALRVVQVTMFLCMLLYSATLKFDMVTVEYLGAVALDTFIYCYYGNQIIIQQADRVSTAAFQSGWATCGARARRSLLTLQLANLRPVAVRAADFLPMNLHTFLLIIKTSFSYYTLLVNVNEK